MRVQFIHDKEGKVSAYGSSKALYQQEGMKTTILDVCNGELQQLQEGWRPTIIEGELHLTETEAIKEDKKKRRMLQAFKQKAKDEKLNNKDIQRILAELL